MSIDSLCYNQSSKTYRMNLDTNYNILTERGNDTFQTLVFQIRRLHLFRLKTKVNSIIRKSKF